MEAYHFIGPVLAALTAVSLGGMALVGVRIWARRPRSLTEEEMADVRRRLRDDIREEVTQAFSDRDVEIEDLHERLEFAERVLAQGRALGPPAQDAAAGDSAPSRPGSPGSDS